MDKTKKALKAAFPLTIPVMAGYIFMGIAFGILLESKGFGFGWSFLMAVCIFAGSMQFVAVGLLAGGFHPVQALAMTLMVNARHIFYGLSMLEKFGPLKLPLKLYMVFTLTDETFSLHCASKPPEGVDENRFRVCVAFLDHIYWITGCTLGGLAGAAFAFDTRGIDFVMTALFVTIFLEQWHTKHGRLPALVGVAGSAFCLLLFGPSWFIIPAMFLLVMVLTALREPIEGGIRT